MARVLIAGCGYVGSALGERLVDDSHVTWGLRRVTASLAYRYWENAGSFRLDDFDQSRIVLALTYRH